MYFGSKSLKALEGHIYGYQTALQVHKIEEERFFYSTHFNEWLLYSRKVGSKCSIMGWANYLIEISEDEGKAFDKFFELYDEFMMLQPVSKKYVQLDGIKKRSKEYYELNPWHEHAPIPVSIELMQYVPDKLYYLKYHYQDGALVDRNIWKTLKSAINNVHWEFGIGVKRWLTVGGKFSA